MPEPIKLNLEAENKETVTIKLPEEKIQQLRAKKTQVLEALHILSNFNEE